MLLFRICTVYIHLEHLVAALIMVLRLGEAYIRVRARARDRIRARVRVRVRV